MNDPLWMLAAALAAALITFAERALPFVAGSWLQRQEWVRRLGDFLPLSIMVILTVSTAWDAWKSHGGLPVPEVSAIALTMALQWFFRSPLVSIFGGTALYVVLRNFIF